MQHFVHHWSADVVWHWRTATVADGSRELLASRCDNLYAHRLAPAHPRIIVCCAHSVQTCSSDHTFFTSSDLTLHHATPQRSTHHSHTPATYSHTCMNPTAELVRVKSSGGSTKVGGSTTADDTPSCVPDAVAHLVSVFQGDNSNLLPFITPRQPKLPCRSTTHCSHTATATTTTNPHAADVGEQPAVLEAARPNAGHLYR
jgi:hypothetical protein